MKRILNILLSTLVLIFLIACNGTGHEESSEKNITAANDFSKVFEGKINNQYPIIAKIQAKQGKVSGTYFYTKVGQELRLEGTLNADHQLLIREYDQNNQHTGTFEGKIVPPDKLEGSWFSTNAKNKMSFILTESGLDYKTAKTKSLKKSIKILYRQEEFDQDLKANILKLKLNEDFLKIANDEIRAILGYYSTKAGTECWWKDNQPNSTYSNLDCKLTTALKLGIQCSEEHKSFLRQWFSSEQTILEEIDNCYTIPYTASTQTTFDYLNLEILENEITVKYKTSGVNLKMESDWETEGVDKFLIENNTIKVISRKVNKN